MLCAKVTFAAKSLMPWLVARKWGHEQHVDEQHFLGGGAGGGGGGACSQPDNLTN